MSGPADQPVALAFDDNSLLPVVFGEFDRNLARIEQLLGVSIRPFGNRLTILGPAGPAETAKTALLSLHRRARKGGIIDQGEVDAAVRLADPAARKSAGGGANGGGAPGGDDAPHVIRTRKRPVEARSATQKLYVDALHRHELVFGIGPAGTGKTYLAVAVAVAMLIAGKVDRVILCRPAVEAGERLGFLPGDMQEKINPYLRPLYDALHDMMPADEVARRLANGEIEAAPLAFMRGRTLANAFVILDEAQNTTPTQMKMFLTRLGENSRMAVTGDLSQVDLPLGAKSGLRDALETLNGVDGVGFIQFCDADVVRHALVTRIVRAYQAHEGRLTAPLR